MIDLRPHGATLRGLPLVAVSENLADRLRCTDPVRLAQRLPAVLGTLDEDGRGILTVVSCDGVSAVAIRGIRKRDGLGVLLEGEAVP